MKNIMLIILNSSYGGAERHVVDICKHLDRSRFKLSIIVPENSKIERTVQEIKKVSEVEVYSINRGLTSVSSISKIIKRERPDTIHVHSPRATLTVAISASFARYRGCLLTTAHGWIPKRLKLNKMIERVYVSSLKRYTKFIAVSNEVKETLISNNISPNKIDVIYNGVEIQESNNNTVVSERKIIFLGRFIGEKGLIYLMEALQAVSQGPSKDKLVIDFYGDGPLQPLVDETIEKLGSNTIRNCGFLNPEAVIKTLKKYDLMVMPSVQEGFPYTLVEAFSAGVPVIASSVGGIPEALKHGYNGFLVEPRNSQNLQETIEYFLNLEDEAIIKLKKNARSSSNNYSIQNMMEQIEKVYDYN